MYDEKKLNAYWEEREFVLDTWYNNGWHGPGTPNGRDVTYPCGHTAWAGYGLSDLEVFVVGCRCETKEWPGK